MCLITDWIPRLAGAEQAIKSAEELHTRGACLIAQFCLASPVTDFDVGKFCQVFVVMIPQAVRRRLEVLVPLVLFCRMCRSLNAIHGVQQWNDWQILDSPCW